jgi:hypothetical protein
MYGTRGTHTIRNFVLTFLAGWLFAQVFTIAPKTVLPLDSQPIRSSTISGVRE